MSSYHLRSLFLAVFVVGFGIFFTFLASAQSHNPSFREMVRRRVQQRNADVIPARSRVEFLVIEPIG